MIIRSGILVAALLLAISAVVACPFCPTAELPLAEQLAQSDAAVLVQWKSAEPASPEKKTAGSTTFGIVKVVHQPGVSYETGSTITLDRSCSGNPGDLFLLMGDNADAIQWRTPLAVTETGFKYIVEAPSREVPSSKRLPYFLKYLEHPDEQIAKDAFSEFAAAPYREIEPLARQFSAAKLREWIAKKETNQARLGFYGMMLGLAGEKKDAEFLKAEINRPTETYRLGLDGMMAGYALLTGADGLELLDEKLTAESGTAAPTYAAMQTLRFLWEYENARVGKDRLRRSMRILIGRSEFTDLAIKDLARWEDWEIIPTLMELYDQPDQSDSRIKRAVIHFLLVMSKKRVPMDDKELVAHVARANACLRILKERDAKLVKDAERYTFW
jgi:hypothetical protein